MITESEKFLNKIEKQKLDLSNLKSDFTDLESFLEVYELLNNNLNKLSDHLTSTVHVSVRLWTMRS